MPTASSAIFDRLGFLPPFRVFTETQCQLIGRHLALSSPPAPIVWIKDRGATDRFLYDLAQTPALLSVIRAILGDDVVLWGASEVAREPGQVHPWHTDIESSAPDGRFASAWIGLANTRRQSGLKFVTGSHGFGEPIQKRISGTGLRRGEASDDTVLAWAQSHDPASTIEQPNVCNGEALVFDGRIWHASDNRTRDARTALLLQYAAAGSRVFVPDLARLEWPFARSEKEAPVVSVLGEAKGALPPPQHRAKKPIGTAVHPFSLPVGGRRLPWPFRRKQPDWKPYPLFAGASASVDSMSCHMSVLQPGHSPHPPHAHAEEEILIVLKGAAEIVLTERPNDGEARRMRLRRGSFGYYPAYQFHTIRNSSRKPTTYLMFKWRGRPVIEAQPMGVQIAETGKLFPGEGEGFATKLLFERPTAYLKTLHCHLTRLSPGAGYDAHADAYDVAILLLSGTIEANGQELRKNGLLYFAKGERHDMRNVGREAARYIVFEFHGPDETGQDPAGSSA